MNSSDLTVIMPVYNHAHYLPEAIDSVLKQTALPMRMILVDDASLDDSAKVASEYAAKYSFIEFVQNKFRVGPNAIFNMQLEKAKTTYTFFMSADDSAHPMLFEIACACLDKHPSAGVFSALSDVMDENSRFIKRYYSPVVRLTPSYLSPKACKKLYQTDGNWILGGTRIFKTSVLKEVGSFPEELGSFSDTYVAAAIAVSEGAYFYPYYLSQCRVVAGNYSGNTMRNPELLKQILQKAEKKFLEKHCFNKQEVILWKKRFMLSAVISLLDYKENLNLEMLKNFIPEEFGLTRQVIKIFYPILKLRCRVLTRVLLYILIRPTDFCWRFYRYFFYTIPCRINNRKSHGPKNLSIQSL